MDIEKGAKPMNELKPEDVMRALECCLQADGAPDCYKLKCPARLGNGLCFYEIDCEFNSEEEALKKMLADALALLREKDAEIERYKCVIRLLEKDVADAKSEAINEFAQKVKTFYHNLSGKTVGGSVEYHIDMIAKEMKGENNNDH